MILRIKLFEIPRIDNASKRKKLPPFQPGSLIVLALHDKFPRAGPAQWRQHSLTSDVRSLNLFHAGLQVWWHIVNTAISVCVIFFYFNCIEGGG